MEIVLFLIFATIVTLGLAAASFGQRPEQRRLARLAGDDVVRRPGPETEGGGVLARQDLNMLDRLMQPFAGKQERASSEALANVRRRLTYAGFRRETSVMTYMGSRVVFAGLLPTIVLLTPASWNLEQLQLVFSLCAAAGIGLIAPSYW